MKTIVIAGASSGIGLATAQRLLRDGHTVLCVARHDCPDPGVLSYRADLSIEGERRAFLDWIDANRYPVTDLFYAAGCSMAAPFQYTEESHYRYLWEVNYFGFVHLAQALLPAIRRAQGHIVVASSMAAVAPIPYDCFYSSSKAALNVLIHDLACELHPLGVKVTAVMPGGTRTSFTKTRMIYTADQSKEYDRAVLNAAATLALVERKGMSADKVAQRIQQVLYDDQPPLLVPVGITNATLYGLTRCLPTACNQALTVKLFGTDLTHVTE